MKTEFKMTGGDLAKILDACKPVTYMVFGGIPPRSPQENANSAWAELGRKMGFDSTTVEPIESKSNDYFMAEPLEPISPMDD